MNENVLESDVVRPFDGIMRHCSIADLRLLEGRGANMVHAVYAVHMGATRRGRHCAKTSL